MSHLLCLELSNCSFDVPLALGPSVWSVFRRSSRDRPHEKQNGVNWLKCTPQKGQNIVQLA